jgi:hypothetical protein
MRGMMINEKISQMKYWITVVSKTGKKLEIQCLNPFWDSQMPHSTVSKKPISEFFKSFHLFSFFSDVQLWPLILSDFSKQY